MSGSLVKKALYIVDSDGDEDNQQIKEHGGLESGKAGKKQGKSGTKSAGRGKKKVELTCYGLSSDRSRLEDYRRKQANDRTKDNLKMIKKVRSDKIERNLATNLLKEMGKIDTPKSNQVVGEANFVTEDDFKRYVKHCLR